MATAINGDIAILVRVMTLGIVQNDAIGSEFVRGDSIDDEESLLLCNGKDAKESRVRGRHDADDDERVERNAWLRFNLPKSRILWKEIILDRRPSAACGERVR
jgi:hypothetical protein